MRVKRGRGRRRRRCGGRLAAVACECLRERTLLCMQLYLLLHAPPRTLGTSTSADIPKTQKGGTCALRHHCGSRMRPPNERWKPHGHRSRASLCPGRIKCTVVAESENGHDPGSLLCWGLLVKVVSVSGLPGAGVPPPQCQGVLSLTYAVRSYIHGLFTCTVLLLVAVAWI